MADGAKQDYSCPRCGGETAKATLKAGDREATVVVAGKPDGFLGVVPYTTSPVGARVCRACGHIELYARDLRDLLAIDAADGSDD
jgi:predicted nucleic-acid-binding Zn-ribbon protein